MMPISPGNHHPRHPADPPCHGSNHTPESPLPPSPRGLRWGIKASFLSYIARLPDGSAALGAGMESIDDQDVVFPIDRTTGPPERPDALRLRFSGEVRFGGHRGLLFVRVADPWLHLGDGVGEMSVADPFLEDATARVTLVTFAFPTSAAQSLWTASEVRLAEAGTPVFNDIYAADEPFESFAII